MTNPSSPTFSNQHDSQASLITPPSGYCFHCGDPVPNPPFYAHVLEEDREMCCMGCQLACESIVEAGLEQYYLDRTEINRTASLPTELTRLQAYDHDDVRSQFIYAHDKGNDNLSVAELSVSNLRCAACSWLIESRLYEVEGVAQCQVNLTNQRMRVIWDESKHPISDILHTVHQVGYDAKPYRQDTHEAMLAKQNKQMLIRLGIAALGAMQAMMFAVALYFGEYKGMELIHRDFLRWVSLFVSVPVFFYAGLPFFSSAWSAIKIRQVNMDVPVSIALLVTFFASTYATLTGVGETYFDSVSMFIFFLLAGRYIEQNARLKASNMANDLVVIEPLLVKKIAEEPQVVEQLSLAVNNTINNDSKDITDQVATNQVPIDQFTTDNQSSFSQDGDDPAFKTTVRNIIESLNASLKQSSKMEKPLNQEMVSLHSLKVGDVIEVDAGMQVISDGILLSDHATVSQSLLTGESDLIHKTIGDAIIGGSQNDSQPFVMLVTTLPEESQIGLIDRLMNRAMSEKPAIAKKADKLARWFVARVLLFSLVVFAGWYIYHPADAIWATVAVLVATCPCALSLATPIALTVSTNRLATYGFLATRGHTIETLSEISHVAFDKTGTLTYGKPTLLAMEVVGHPTETLNAMNAIQEGQKVRVDSNQSNQSTKDKVIKDKVIKDKLLAIAASLEVGSRHPIAHALLSSAYQLHLPPTENLITYPAGGVEAMISNHWAFHIDETNTDIETAIETTAKSQKFRIGHLDFALENEGHSPSNTNKVVPNLEKHNANIVVVLSMYQNDQWQPLAYFYFNDKIREDAKETVTKLKQAGITPIMLTGDPNPKALEIAKQLGIDDAYYALSPEDKVTHIKQLQANNTKVLMVGDGINDAPVLATADVSTAMAGAADLAQVSSDSIIINERFNALVKAKTIADKAQKIIKQNFTWAIGYNAIVLLPAALGYVPPWLAAIGMSISSLVVVLNALRLKRA